MLNCTFYKSESFHYACVLVNITRDYRPFLVFQLFNFERFGEIFCFIKVLFHYFDKV